MILTATESCSDICKTAAEEGYKTLKQSDLHFYLNTGDKHKGSDSASSSVTSTQR